MKRIIPPNNVLALVHSEEYSGWVIGEQHTTQGRRYIADSSMQVGAQ